MQLQKFRWSKVYESSEEELVAFLEARSVTTNRYDQAPFQQLDQLPATTDTTLWCAEGSATIKTDIKALSFQPGDGIHIPATMAYSFTAGMSGCVYYESAK